MVDEKRRSRSQVMIIVAAVATIGGVLCTNACGSDPAARTDATADVSDANADGPDTAEDLNMVEDDTTDLAQDTGPPPDVVLPPVGAFCVRQEAMLRVCDLLTEGYLPCSEPAAETADFDLCGLACREALSCPALTIVTCTDEFDTDLEACLTTCTPPTFPCADGSATLEPSAHCDGTPECADGSDEVGCPVFACDDGSTVSANLECDLVSDCPDGSDEASCSRFACADGGLIPSFFVCDGFGDCGDASDEAGCPTIAEAVCP